MTTSLFPSAPAAAMPMTMPKRPSILSRFTDFIRCRHWTFYAGAAIFLVIILLLVIAPWISPYDPAKQNLRLRLNAPSALYWLGTDHLGRDVLSRLLIGGRFTVTIAAITVILSVVIGTFIGIISGRSRGILDEVLMRIVDLLIAIPDVVIAIFLVAIFGPGYGTLIASLTIVGWTPFARLARGLTLSINSREYIRAAEVLGCTRRFIIFRHIIPNTIWPIAAVAFLRFGHKLITVGGLSFLGLGVQPPAADWALMLADAQAYAERMPLLVIAPGLAIFLAALSVTWIGHGLNLETKKTNGH
ncbi:Glutathione transport system permease protein GsiD [compost metagenome]|jgi:peptide/nickel transport system permease protein|uniref:ABC transporter permease n=1 Tax=Agrobacterium radiobacter TaxID=362 RepID=A0ABD5LLW9_AGRRD|nr:MULTISPECIES: ABC transporter permease [Agrobacterium tumefaciens complex]MCP2135095.1 peptide/nickel transport system permease protein [Rhizobium sp. SLBN-94]TGE82472.1 ABC transporter permease [Rhizobium sp. SEMIA 439]EPR20239.1 ABC transporter permease [Agrobacterium radiobacter DSM 30147]KAA1236610.1 ABC transporter permease [Agrobacterium tumefaciens]KAB0462712.1 ABC transporter permease [Agrobacterium tumefaciens]